ncbi:MAG: DUF4340 domain-containing protein, partial [Acidobacteriota bacterium]
QWTLAGLLVVQILLLFMMHSSLAPASAAVAPHPFLPVLGSITAVRLELDDADGKNITLEHSGDEWILEEKDGYPVDGSKVDELLDSLKQAKVRRPVVTSNRYHDSLKVSEKTHEHRLKVWDSAENEKDDPKVDLFLGTSPNYRITHARLGGDNRVYEVAGLNSWQFRAEPGAWVKKKFVDVPADQVTGFRLENEHGTFELQKKDGQWSLVSPKKKGKDLDSSKVEGLVSSFAALYLQDPVGKMDEEAQGLAKPAAIIRITRTKPAPEETGDAGSTAAPDSEESAADAEGPEAPAAPEVETTTVRIGKISDEKAGTRFATRSGFDFAVTLGKYDAEKAVNQNLEDLLNE